MLYKTKVGSVEVQIRDKGRPIREITIRSEDLPELWFTSIEDRNVLWFDGEKVCYLYVAPRVAVSFHVEEPDGVRMAPLATSLEVNEPLWEELARKENQKAVVEYVAQKARKFSSEKEALKELLKALRRKS